MSARHMLIMIKKAHRRWALNTGGTLQISLNSRVYRPLNTLRRQSPWVMGEPHLAPDQDLQKRCWSCAGQPPAPCLLVPMSPYELHLLLYPLQARTDRVRHALRRRPSKRGEAGWTILYLGAQLPESIHSQPTPDTHPVQERRWSTYKIQENSRRSDTPKTGAGPGQDRAKGRGAGAW